MRMWTTSSVCVGVIASVLAVAPASARATQAGEEDSEDPDAPAPRAEGGKSPWLAATLTGGTALLGYGTALALAVGTDFEPEVMGVGALAIGLLGPAAGHIYVGRNAHHPVLFALARVTSVGVGFLGLAELMRNDDGQVVGLKPNKALGFTLVGLSVAGVLGSTVWEATDSYACAQATHDKPTSVAVAPLLAPGHAGGLGTAGVSLAGRF